MFDREAWRFFNTFAPWFSALGSIMAVIVALYLARRSSRLDVRVFPGIVTMVTPGVKTNRPEFFQIRAVNHGRDAVITGIGWWYRGLRRRGHNWVVLPPGNEFSTTLPARLEFGAEALLLFPTASYNKDADSLLKFIAKSRFPQITVRLLRVGVFASTGQSFRVRLDPHLRKFILERAKQVRTSVEPQSA